MSLIPGYRLRIGSTLDRSRLLKFMQKTYAEMEPGGDFAHLAQTVDQYLSLETPLWWVEPVAETLPYPTLIATTTPIACLWLGTAIDQIHGDAHAHVFLLYVAPAHRRQGIGAALMRHAEDWAIARGDRQIGLQVFEINHAARGLYQKLGFEARSLWMVKSLE